MFSTPMQAFGFEVKPNDFDEWNVRLGLEDGTTEIYSLAGFADAQFFGWVSDNPLDLSWFEIEAAPGSLGFGMGRFVQGAAQVNDQGDRTGWLLLVTLIGLAHLQRRLI